MTDKVYIEVTPRQAAVLESALDLYSRVLAGQWDEVLSATMYCLPPETYSEVSKRLPMEDARLTLEVLAAAFSGGGRLGPLSNKVPEQSRIAYDMYQSVREFLAWKRNPKGTMQVCFDRPMPYSTEPLPVVKDASGWSPGEAEQKRRNWRME